VKSKTKEVPLFTDHCLPIIAHCSQFTFINSSNRKRRCS